MDKTDLKIIEELKYYANAILDSKTKSFNSIRNDQIFSYNDNIPYSVSNLIKECFNKAIEIVTTNSNNRKDIGHSDTKQESFTSNEIDFAYLIGVFNSTGIDGLHKELNRLKGLDKKPHNIIDFLKQGK